MAVEFWHQLLRLIMNLSLLFFSYLPIHTFFFWIFIRIVVFDYLVRNLLRLRFLNQDCCSPWGHRLVLLFLWLAAFTLLWSFPVFLFEQKVFIWAHEDDLLELFLSFYVGCKQNILDLIKQVHELRGCECVFSLLVLVDHLCYLLNPDLVIIKVLDDFLEVRFQIRPLNVVEINLHIRILGNLILTFLTNEGIQLFAVHTCYVVRMLVTAYSQVTLALLLKASPENLDILLELGVDLNLLRVQRATDLWVILTNALVKTLKTYSISARQNY